MNQNFLYIITNLLDGQLQGTDNITIALECSRSDDHFVFDVERCQAIVDGEHVPIRNLDALEEAKQDGQF
jgi:hypothetical protein